MGLFRWLFEGVIPIKKTVDEPQEGPVYEYGRWVRYNTRGLSIPNEWFIRNGFEMNSNGPILRSAQDRMILEDYVNSRLSNELNIQNCWITIDKQSVLFSNRVGANMSNSEWTPNEFQKRMLQRKARQLNSGITNPLVRHYLIREIERGFGLSNVIDP